MSKPQWHVLLTRNRKMVFTEERQRKDTVQCFPHDRNQNHASFVDEFFKLYISTYVLDISGLFKQIEFAEYQQI